MNVGTTSLPLVHTISNKQTHVSQCFVCHNCNVGVMFLLWTDGMVKNVFIRIVDIAGNGISRD